MSGSTSLECPTTGHPCLYREHLQELYQPVREVPIWQPLPQRTGIDQELPTAVRPELDSSKLNAFLIEHSVAAKMTSCVGPSGEQGEICPTALKMADSKPRQGLRAVFRLLFNRGHEVNT